MEFKAKSPDGKANIAGRHLKEYRAAKGLSLREMAAKLQVGGLDWDHTQVLRAENGEKAINDVELKYLSAILKISPKKLLEYNGDTEQSRPI